jgi:signal transduction histidine kinase
VRRWLALYALSVTSIVVLAFLVPLAILVRDLAGDRVLNAAEREAQTVARFASSIDGGPEDIVALDGTLAGSPETSVVLSDGAVIGAALPTGVDLTAAQQRGQAYRQPLADGTAIVVPVLRGSGSPWVIVVAVSGSELTRGVGSAWAILTVLGLVLIGLAFLVADRMGRAVVDPITDLVEATERLGQGELSVEVEPAGPKELAAVGYAFNALTGRVRTLLDGEREMAADLSHQLRTPLTALKLDIEALGDEVDTERLQRDVDELERVVGYVISEARRPVREAGTATADLAAIVEERTEYWGALADDQGRRWATHIERQGCLVRGSSDDFQVLIDALLGNIFAHTPPGTPYRIDLHTDGEGHVELAVSDGGPGIPDDRLLERGISGGSSTGLGADIVRRTAEAAGGTVSWESGESSGTVVRVALPLVSGPSS